MKLKEIYADGEMWRIALADGKPYCEKKGEPWGNPDREIAKLKWQTLLLDVPMPDNIEEASDGTE